jgi:hypothetical protein
VLPSVVVVLFLNDEPRAGDVDDADDADEDVSDEDPEDDHVVAALSSAEGSPLASRREFQPRLLSSAHSAAPPSSAYRNKMSLKGRIFKRKFNKLSLELLVS